MCGFLAHVLFGPLSQGPFPALPEKALRALHHRGPDASGSWEDQGEGWHARLLHTRLKIIDLSDAAAQPMAGSDRRLRLVFNGEIYNFRELRRELAAQGRAFRSSSDTEVLLATLEVFGIEAISRLEGMFAFALWDGRSRSLLLARDRLGIKPLYLARSAGAVAAASEVRALVVGGAAAATPSVEGLASYFAFGSVAEPWTAIAGVEALEPGTWSRFEAGRAESGRFWRPRPTAHLVPRAEAAGEVRRLVQRAVESQVVSDVPLGAFLSGGMDSGAVATALSRLADARRFETFTVGFPRGTGGGDERDGASATARACGLRHHLVELTPADCLEDVPPFLDALDQPSIDGANTWFVSKAVRRQGIVVALSGLGGDELFGGYPHLRQAHWTGPLLDRLGRSPLRPDGTRALAHRGTQSKKLALLLRHGGNPRALYAIRRGLFLLPTDSDLATPDLVAAWARHAEAFVGGEEPCGSASSADRQTRYELANYLRNTLLRDTDVMSMRHGLEVRVPLLDNSLLDYVLALPPSLRFRPFRQKPLLAEALGLQKVPAKRGFTLPFADWLRGPLRAEVEPALRGRGPGERFVRAEAARALWTRFLAGEDRLWTRVWAIYVLNRWLERMARW